MFAVLRIKLDIHRLRQQAEIQQALFQAILDVIRCCAVNAEPNQGMLPPEDVRKPELSERGPERPVPVKEVRRNTPHLPYAA